MFAEGGQACAHIGALLEFPDATSATNALAVVRGHRAMTANVMPGPVAWTWADYADAAGNSENPSSSAR